MATAPVITTLQLNSEGGVTVNFTHSGASTEVFYLLRKTKYLTSTEQTQVRKITRNSATYIYDFTAPLADVTVEYQIKATNADGSGAVFSNTKEIVLTCLDYSTVTPIYSLGNDRKMLYATSRDGSRGRPTVYHKFAGRRYPVAEKGIQRSETIKVEWYVERYDEYLEFQTLMTEQDFWYRDNSGRSFHASTDNVDVKDHQTLNGFTCSAELTRIDGGIEN